MTQSVDALNQVSGTKSSQSHANSGRCLPLICASPAAILHCDNRIATQRNEGQASRQKQRNKQRLSGLQVHRLRILAPCLTLTFQAKQSIPSKMPIMKMIRRLYASLFSLGDIFSARDLLELLCYSLQADWPQQAPSSVTLTIVCRRCVVPIASGTSISTIYVLMAFPSPSGKITVRRSSSFLIFIQLFDNQSSHYPTIFSPV